MNERAALRFQLEAEVSRRKTIEKAYAAVTTSVRIDVPATRSNVRRIYVDIYLYMYKYIYIYIYKSV